MKFSVFCFSLFLGALATTDASSDARYMKKPQTGDVVIKEIKIRLRIGAKRLSATFFDNPTSKQILSLFPMTASMKDLYSNEKYFDLPGRFPTQASRPKEIKAGDIMLYGTNTLVLFYETFSTSYSYTKIGEIDEPSQLKSILGPGDVEVTFEVD